MGGTGPFFSSWDIAITTGFNAPGIVMQYRSNSMGEKSGI